MTRRHFLLMLGGALAVESTPRQGTMVRVVWPMADGG
jgi:signal transduction histidine kinase